MGLGHVTMTIAGGQERGTALGDIACAHSKRRVNYGTTAARMTVDYHKWARRQGDVTGGTGTSLGDVNGGTRGGGSLGDPSWGPRSWGPHPEVSQAGEVGTSQGDSAMELCYT